MSDYPQETIDTLRNVIATQQTVIADDWIKIEKLNRQLGAAIGTLRGLIWCNISDDAKAAISRVLAEIDKEE